MGSQIAVGFETLAQMFYERSEHYKTKTLLLRRTEKGWEEIAWETCGETTRKLAIALSRMGVNPGDRVAILSENRPEWLFADMAVQSLGASIVPLYTSQVAADIEYILKDAGCRLMIASDGALAERARAVAKNVEDLSLIFIGGDAQDTPNLESLIHEPYDSDEKSRLTESIARGSSEDIATIIYTSGTTGPPKGVMLTHKNLLANCEATLEHVEILPTDRALSFLPLSHSFERTAGHYVMIHAGAEIAYAQSVTTVSEDLIEVKPTVLLGVPRFYEKIYARIIQKVADASGLQQKAFAWGTYVGRQVFHRHDRGENVPWHLLASHAAAKSILFKRIVAATGGRLRYLVSGGAPLAPVIIEFFEAVGLHILEGYGLTETSPIISCNQPNHRRLGSVGMPIRGVEVRIAHDGEILVKGPSIMKGYFRRPEETKDAFDDDGFFKTGDVGYLDEDGFLFVTDRKKDIIITAGGKNVAPQNIENKLQVNKHILQAAIIGDRRPFLTALIVPDFDVIKATLKMSQEGTKRRRDLIKQADVQDLLRSAVAKVNSELASFETVKRFAILAKPFSQETDELTPTLKLKRRVVERRHSTSIEELYNLEGPPGQDTVIIEFPTPKTAT